MKMIVNATRKRGGSIGAGPFVRDVFRECAARVCAGNGIRALSRIEAGLLEHIDMDHIPGFKVHSIIVPYSLCLLSLVPYALDPVALVHWLRLYP